MSWTWWKARRAVSRHDRCSRRRPAPARRPRLGLALERLEARELLAASLSITPITWNVVGLDQNGLTQGPNPCPSGVRVTNTGNATATNVTATWTWDSSNAFVNLVDQPSLSIPSLAAGASQDFYFTVQITPNASAINTARRFHVTASADSVASVSTPVPREIFVEKLNSQQRNSVNSFTGPTTVVVGQTAQYVLTAQTSSQFAELITPFSFSNSVFRVVSMSVTYTNPAGTTNTKFWEDAGGWDSNPSSPTYLSVIGPPNVPGGSVGGIVVVTANLLAVQAGTTTLNPSIDDFSGNSFHYNTGPSLAVTAVADYPLTPVPKTFNATEGAAFSGVVGSFTDGDPAPVLTDFSATITWGDGHTSSGTITPNLSGGFDVSGTNTYVEEGSYGLRVTIRDKGGSSVSVTGTATVADAALTAAGVAVTATEGSPFNGAVATFTDPGTDGTTADYSAKITWGDGHTSAGVVSQGGGVFTVSGSNTYAEEGSYTVSVLIQDKGGSSTTASSTAAVGDAALSAAGKAITALEGASYNGAVATFTDPGTDGTTADYSATITWGDGHTSAGVVSQGGGVFTVSGSNTYAEEGSYTVSVLIQDKGGSSTTASSTATVGDAPLSATGLTVQPVEGIPFTGVVANFTDANSGATTADFTASIDWGDGHTSAGTITTDPNGGFDVSGTNTYSQINSYTITVTILDKGGSQATAQTMADVGSVGIVATGVPVAAVEGQPFNGTVATFTDANEAALASDFTASITWGDGQTSAGTVTSNEAGGFDVRGTNTYAEEGSYTVSVIVLDKGGSGAAAQTTATVADAALHAAGQSLGGIEGSATNGTVATFTDDDPAGTVSDYTATIDWGDGHTTAGTIVAVPTGGFAVLGSNRYAEEGDYSVRVSIADQGGATTTAAGTATVLDASLVATGTSISAVEGNLFAGAVANFSDSGTDGTANDYRATIDWGDGQTSAGIITALPDGTFNVSGSHTYAEEGSYTARVSITDQGGATTTTSSTANVADAPLSGAGHAVAATEGSGFSGTVATFHDADPGGSAADFTATITWGDGHTSAGTILADGAGGFIVSGSNTYAEEGAYSVDVAISDKGGSTLGVSAAANVADAPLSVSAQSISAVEGTPINTVVATFSDPGTDGTLADYSATIDWGDGLTSVGVIGRAADGTLQISGGHTYATVGTFALRVTLNDKGGSSATGQANATVTDAPLSISGIPVSTVAGSPFSGPVATFQGGSPSDQLDEFTATIDWGDGTTGPGIISVNADGSFSVSGAHTFQHGGSSTGSVTVHDRDGASATAGVPITVTPVNVPPTITAPASVTTLRNTVQTLGSSVGQAITVGDIDANGGAEQVTLSVAHGTLNLAPAAGVTVTGNGTNKLVLTGGIAALDTILARLTYTPAAEFTGSDSLALAINDQGHSGFGGPRTATTSVAIRVLPPASAPQGSLTGSVFVDANNNGVEDPGEMGLPDITVVLSGVSSDGHSVSLTQVTDASGGYAFTGLPQGQYTVTRVQPDAFLAGQNSAGTAGGVAGENSISHITLGAGVAAQDYQFGERGLVPGLVSKRFFLSSSDATEALPMLMSGQFVSAQAARPKTALGAAAGDNSSFQARQPQAELVSPATAPGSLSSTSAASLSAASSGLGLLSPNASTDGLTALSTGRTTTARRTDRALTPLASLPDSVVGARDTENADSAGQGLPDIQELQSSPQLFLDPARSEQPIWEHALELLFCARPKVDVNGGEAWVVPAAQHGVSTQADQAHGVLDESEGAPAGWLCVPLLGLAWLAVDRRGIGRSALGRSARKSDRDEESDGR